MKIEVLGTGCAKCESLADKAKAAAEGLGVPYELLKVSDLNEITKRGVIMTPALAIDGEVRVMGKVPDEAELTTMLTDAMS